jgi:hypothetical protein
MYIPSGRHSREKSDAIFICKTRYSILPENCRQEIALVEIVIQAAKGRYYPVF